MQDFFEPLLGPTGATIAQFAIWTVAILVVLLAGWWIVGRLIGLGRRGFSRGRVPRLAIIDALALDQRRRLVLVRRDGLEHLILIGGSGDVVVETGIHRQKPAQKASEKRGGDTAHTIALPPLPPRTTALAAGAVVVPANPVVAPRPPEPAPTPVQAPEEAATAEAPFDNGVRLEPMRRAPEQATVAHFGAGGAEPDFRDDFQESNGAAGPFEPAEPEPPVAAEPPAAPRRLIIPAPVTPADFADGRPSQPAETSPFEEAASDTEAQAVPPAEPRVTEIPDVQPAAHANPDADPHPFAPHRAPEVASDVPLQAPLPQAPQAEFPADPPIGGAIDPLAADPGADPTAPATDPMDFPGEVNLPAVDAPPPPMGPVAPPEGQTPADVYEAVEARESPDDDTDRGETTRVEELRREMARLLGEAPRRAD